MVTVFQRLMPFLFSSVVFEAMQITYLLTIFVKANLKKVQIKRVQINGWSKSNLIKIKPVLYDQLWM